MQNTKLINITNPSTTNSLQVLKILNYSDIGVVKMKSNYIHVKEINPITLLLKNGY